MLHHVAVIARFHDAQEFLDELSIVALSMVAPYKWIFVIEVIDVGIQSRAAPLLVDIIMISFFCSKPIT